MADKMPKLKSFILDLRNKIEAAEERHRRAAKVLKIKQLRLEVLWEDVALKRRKLALKKETLRKTYELLEDKHQKLEEVDELLYTNMLMSKKLKELDWLNSQKCSSLEVALKKTRTKAQEFENKTKDLKIRTQVYARAIQMANIAKVKADRKRADLQSKFITRKSLLERLGVKYEEFHEREKDYIDKLRMLNERTIEATTRAEAAEKRSHLFEDKVSKLRQELNQQTSDAKKLFALKNELEHLSLEH